MIDRNAAEFLAAAEAAIAVYESKPSPEGAAGDALAAAIDALAKTMTAGLDAVDKALAPVEEDADGSAS